MSLESADMAGDIPSMQRRDAALKQPWHIDKSPASRNSKQVTVLGAGIAGCTAAVALAKRGFDVRVIDRHPEAGCEGSGNNQAIVYPKLSSRDDVLPRINLASMKFATEYYRPFWQQGLGQQCGVIVLPESDKVLADFRIIGERFKDQPALVQLLQNQNLCALSGLNLQAELGLHFPQLGWLKPAEICRQLLAQNQIPLVRADIYQIQQTNGQWHLLDQEHRSLFTSETLVIANAYGCQQFKQTEFLPVTQLRGQVSYLEANPESSKLKTVICGEGYITPEHNGLHSCGATYNKGVFTTAVREQDHQTNIEQMSATDRGLGTAIAPQDHKDLHGRANYRCTTKDYLPIVGPVPDLPSLIEDYSVLRRDARARISAYGSYFPNLYIHCGMGSRGLSYAPLTAEVLAAQIDGKTGPLETELCLAMHPARFVIRDLKKKRI
jgi:tRNA 5-methylaminomethyl-2-thiouridine biosynthesis bifunctional protein